MTMVLRHVHVTDHDVSIYEHFAGFLNVKSSTSSCLIEVLLQCQDQLRPGSDELQGPRIWQWCEYGWAT